jgi:membrane peptidoglycan carboxypeptidase
VGWRGPEDVTADDVPGNTRPLPQPGGQSAQDGAGWYGDQGWADAPTEPRAWPPPQQQQPWQPPPPKPPPYPPPRQRKSRTRRYLKRATITLLTIIVLFAAAAGVLLAVTPSATEATKLAAREAAQHGIAYPGPPVPANFARPLIATEDHRFYAEPGIDPLAIARVVQGKVTGSGDEGGATIEQQLAKLLYTPGQSGIKAELKQVALAVKLNYTYSKAEILRLYAEVAYYGHGYYGLEAASCGYFGHPARDLTVVQGAMLAGVVNAPSADDPINDPGNARARLTHVIQRMVAVGSLTPAQGTRELNTPLGIVPRDQAGC